LRLYNTLSRRIEPVQPRDGEISMYVCGVTPYDVGHLGHLLTYLTYDVIRRRLESEGVRVRHVQNITDVDDDIIRKARELGTTPEELTDRCVAAFDQDMAALNALPAHVYPKVSGTMAQIVAMVERLVAEGYAYEAEGDVYFSIERFPGYGELSRFSRDQMLAESKRQSMRPGPRDPLDFLLWQAKAPGEPFWASPWGEGRPGWHIECSAMAMTHLGEQLDIHGGGADLIYPHHECEIAQSESASGRSPFVRIWAHVGMLRYQGEKMSKSLGNMVFARDLLARYPADAVRLALFSRHYRESWEYTEEAIVRGGERAAALREAAAAPSGGGEALDAGPQLGRIWAALDDDLRSADVLDGLVILADDIRYASSRGSDVTGAQRGLRAVGDILGLTLRDR
jgi:L-cysteine:1D-myo-inositol 2-amino-2-deoxy-alpha-D-glucopyranoside ligase